MFRRIFAVAIAVAVIAVLPVAAEEEVPQAKKHDSLEWYYLVHVQFEPGKTDEAVKMIKEHFMPSAEAAGVKMPKFFMCNSGKWDMVYLYHLDTGITELEWKISPSDAKWLAAFAEQEGGMEAAEEVFAKYDALIKDWDGELVRWVDMKPDEKGDTE
jgi:hypothetical protein